MGFDLYPISFGVFYSLQLSGVVRHRGHFAGLAVLLVHLGAYVDALLVLWIRGGKGDSGG